MKKWYFGRLISWVSMCLKENFAESNLVVRLGWLAGWLVG